MAKILLYNPRTDSYSVELNITPWDVAFITGDTETMRLIREDALKHQIAWLEQRRVDESEKEPEVEKDPFQPSDPPKENEYDPDQEKTDMENELRYGLC